jgi:glycosyltransferase involved in cell wall biosynthesis
VADLVARKRHADVLRALWLLRDAHPDLVWDVYGDGPERPALEQLASELGLADRVTLRGPRTPERGGTVFVLPSVDERRWRHELGEAARRTVAEQFTWPACGRATVAAYRAALA